MDNFNLEIPKGTLELNKDALNNKLNTIDTKY